MNMELGQLNSQISNTGYSALGNGSGGSNGYSGGSTSLMLNFPLSSNTIDENNPLLRFWQQSETNSNYITTPSFMSETSNVDSGYVLASKLASNGTAGVNLQQQQQPSFPTDLLQKKNSESAMGNSNDKYSYSSLSKNSSMMASSPTYTSYGSGRYSSKNTSQRLDSDVLYLGPSGMGNKGNYEYTYAGSNGTTMNSELYERSNLTNFAIPNCGEKKDSDVLQEEVKRYKVELVVKNQIIKNLSDQLNTLNKLKDNRLSEMGWNVTPNKGLKVPSNHYQLFKDLTKTLQERTQELDETKERLEALLVSLAMNEASNTKFTNNGNFDEQELTHKIVSKLSLLQNENENLLKMISFGNKLSLLIELGLLKNENKILKDKIALLEDHKAN